MKQAIVFLVLLSVIAVAYSTSYRCSLINRCPSYECCVFSSQTSSYGSCRGFGNLGDACLVKYGSLKINTGIIYYGYRPCKFGLICVPNKLSRTIGTCRISY